MPSSDSKVYIKCHPTGSEGSANVVYSANAQGQLLQMQNQRPREEDDNIWSPKNWYKNPVILTIFGLILAGLIGGFGYFMWKQINEISASLSKTADTKNTSGESGKPT